MVIKTCTLSSRSCLQYCCFFCFDHSTNHSPHSLQLQSPLFFFLSSQSPHNPLPFLFQTNTPQLYLHIRHILRILLFQLRYLRLFILLSRLHRRHMLLREVQNRVHVGRNLRIHIFLTSYRSLPSLQSRLFPSGTTPSPNPDRYYNPPFRHSLLPCAYDKPRILISVNSRKDHAVQSLLRRINLRLTAHRDAHINQPQELALEAFIGIEHHHHVVVSVHQIIEVPRRQFHLRVNPFALLTSFFRVWITSNCWMMFSCTIRLSYSGLSGFPTRCRSSRIRFFSFNNAEFPCSST